MIIILILIDIIGINKLWGERFDRRVLHHLQRGIYNPNKKPEYYLNQKMYPEDIKEIQSIKQIYSLEPKKRIDTISPMISKLASGNYSEKTTLNINEFDNETQEKLVEIGKKYIPVLEKQINQKLYLTDNNDRCFILRYEGKKTSFTWHYDNEDISCYRALFLFDKNGKIPDFLLIDENKKLKRVKYELGDGIFFKGKKTFHCVEGSMDENCKRYMISFQYTTNPNHIHRSLCSEFQQSFKKMAKSMGPNILIYWIISVVCYCFLSKFTILVDIKILLIFLIINIIIILTIPPILPSYIGTKVPLNIIVISKYLLFMIMLLINPGNAIVYMFYILYTENLLPNRIVGYI